MDFSSLASIAEVGVGLNVGFSLISDLHEYVQKSLNRQCVVFQVMSAHAAWTDGLRAQARRRVAREFRKNTLFGNNVRRVAVVVSLLFAALCVLILFGAAKTWCIAKCWETVFIVTAILVACGPLVISSFVLWVRYRLAMFRTNSRGIERALMRVRVQLPLP